jgi:hypothetical protein
MTSGIPLKKPAVELQDAVNPVVDARFARRDLLAVK